MMEEFEIIDHHLTNNEARRSPFWNWPTGTPIRWTSRSARRWYTWAWARNKGLEIPDAPGKKVEPSTRSIHPHKASIFSKSSATTAARWSIIAEHRNWREDGLDEIYLDLAFEHENLEEYDEALGCLKEAVDPNPENEAVLHELAYCLRSGCGRSIGGVLPQLHERTALQRCGLVLPRQRVGEARPHGGEQRSPRSAVAIDERFTSAYFSRAQHAHRR